MRSHFPLPGRDYADANLSVCVALTIGGALGAVILGRHPRAARVSGAALLAGAACTRFAIFEAGQESARDPRYTVVPQRQRLDEITDGGVRRP